MKELKHLMYFERLLDDAHNELVRKAEAEGIWRSAIPAFTRRRCC